MIREILKENGYVTVKYLTETLHYSNATINRDLNQMELQKMVKRSYGGVELTEQKEFALHFRYHKMKSAKNRIAQKAAEFVKDGDTVLIDGTTTTEAMGRYLEEKKNLTVITNNMALVMFLSNYHIRVICLGGEVIEKPNMLGGAEAIDNIRHFHADKMFFSTGAFTGEGRIGSDDEYDLLHRTMIQQADQVFYLADHEKLDMPYARELQLSDVDYVISDYSFPRETKEKFRQIRFIEA